MSDNDDTSRNEQRNAILDELNIYAEREFEFWWPTGAVLLSIEDLTRLLDAIIDARQAK